MSKVEDIYAGSRCDEWGTPQELWDKLNKQYNFTIDLAASAENTKCDSYLAKDNSFLDWDFGDLFGHVFWLNPPFSLSHAFFTHLNMLGSKCGVAIYKASNTETKTWQEQIFKSATWVHFLAKRINYEGSGKSAPFPSALIGYNVPPPVGIPGVTVCL